MKPASRPRPFGGVPVPYFAVISFDITNGTYDDYKNAYAELGNLGFNKVLKSDDGSAIPLPSTTCG